MGIIFRGLAKPLALDGRVTFLNLYCFRNYPTNIIEVNGVMMMRMEYPNDLHSDFPHLPVQIIFWEGRGTGSDK